jgi:hypothetical protein
VQIVVQTGLSRSYRLDDTSELRTHSSTDPRQRHDHARCDAGCEEGARMLKDAHFDLIQITQRIPHVQRSILSR